MKKVLFSLLMLMAASAAWAVDIVFDATVDVGNGSSAAGEFCIEKDGVSICAGRLHCRARLLCTYREARHLDG